MTWEWVVLILGLVGLFSILVGFSMWINMNTRIYESSPKTLPEMMARMTGTFSSSKKFKREEVKELKEE